MYCRHAGQCRLASRLATKRVAASARARDQHISWIRSSNKDEEGLREIQKIDPLVRPKAFQVKSEYEFMKPNTVSSTSKQEKLSSDIDESALLKDILEPAFKGELGRIELGPFGRIICMHGDVFSLSTASDCLTVFPIPPNLMPYRGLSLEALERGGDSLVREVFSIARLKYADHVYGTDDNCSGGSFTASGSSSTSSSRSSQSESGSTQSSKGLPIGSVIATSTNKLFVVMPYVWQGSTLDANQRLRFTVKSALEEALSRGGNITKILMPPIGRGSFGYDSEWTTELLVEEAIESMLELDLDKPRVKKGPEGAIFNQPNSPIELVFIDNDISIATEFKSAIETLADRWLPDRRLTTAPQYLSKSTERLIVMDERSELDTMRRRDKYKFKQFHGKLRNRGGTYFRHTIQPWIWRTQKVLEPPPLMVKEKTGEIASKQLAARPYYFRGLSHTLFGTAHLRTGFPAMRRNSSGQWVGTNKQPDTQKLAKPKA